MAENIDTTEETTEEDTTVTTSNQFPQDSSVIKGLRSQIKSLKQQNEELAKKTQEEVQKAQQVPDEIAQRMAKLEFDQFITAKPTLIEKKDEIWGVKSTNPNLSYEDATALVLGKSILSGTPAPQAPQVFGNNVNIQPTPTDLASKSDEELATQAKAELEALLG